MNKTQVLPSVMIVLALSASAGYMLDGDWRKTLYWLAAAVLNITVTF